MINDARFLVELDISYAKITPLIMLELTAALAENRQLQTVNLSWNFFTSHNKTNYFDDDRHPDEKELQEQYGRKRHTFADTSPKSTKRSNNDSTKDLPNRPINKEEMS